MNGADEQSRYLLTGPVVSLDLPRRPVDFYRHGWQSWSLTCWHPADAVVPVQKPTILHPMQTDPLCAHRTDASGSSVGAVRFSDGKVLLLGALGTDARVDLAGDTLQGRSDAAAGDPAWLVASGDEESVFRSYAAALGERLGTAPGKPTPRVWCSWYSLYTAITEDVITTMLPGLSEFPVDTIQIDDGWQIVVGDWRPNAKFPSGMPALASRIRDAGKSAGLWLAPLIAVASSWVAREHPEWLLRDKRGRRVSAGFNWGEQLYALDTTHSDAIEWLSSLMRTVREWGFDYLKLDFLYGGALPGNRHSETSRESAYRNALRVMREAAGDAYFVTCGAPIVPSLGLCDAIRIGPDVADFWISNRDEHYLSNPTIPGTRNAIRTTVHRLWLAPIVAVDPDVIYLSEKWNTLTPEQRRLNQALAHICRFTATSDLPAWFDGESASEAVIQAAFGTPKVTRFGPYSFEIDGVRVDFEPALGLPGPRNMLERIGGAILSWLGSRRPAMRLMDAQSRKSAARRLRSVQQLMSAE